MPRDNKQLNSDGSSVYPPIVLAFIAVAITYGALDFGETARRLPLLIGSVTLALIVIDFFSRFENRAGRSIRAAIGADFNNPEMQNTPHWRAEVTQIAWLMLFLAGIIVFGYLAAMPVFTFFYLFFQGRLSVLHSALISVGAALLIAAIFEVILDFELYRGLLFDSNS
ncbi:MAG: hypothetical protein HKN77_05115 [Woeseiaceae bacterium]|nr:hypothetical protein [Woeseiaceae bacterium]